MTGCRLVIIFRSFIHFRLLFICGLTSFRVEDWLVQFHYMVEPRVFTIL